MFESKGAGDEYTDIKVLPLIIICYYSGRGIKKIFFCYMEISILIKQGEVRLGRVKRCEVTNQCRYK